MNHTTFGANYYDMHLDMKLGNTIRRIFREKSLSELETLHHRCELEPSTTTSLALALAILKVSYAGYRLSGIFSNFIDYEEKILWY